MKTVKELKLNSVAVRLIEKEVERAARAVLDLAVATRDIRPELKKTIASTIAQLAAANCQAVY